MTKKQKAYQVHRFVYECFHGLIPPGLVIDHVNNVRDDNRLSNLRLLTQQENSKKSAKNRDYSFVGNNCENRKYVKAINVETDEDFYFESIYAAGKYLGVDPGTISRCCKGEYGRKSGISKKDGQRYSFEYDE